jgi:hypothetical protein
MPYIDQHRRLEIYYDRDAAETAGELNYLITDMINGFLLKAASTDPPITQLKYEHINAVIGVLECAKLELYRRIAAPYEDCKKDINGEVYPRALRAEEKGVTGTSQA